MKTALGKLLGEKGDLAFPHAADTGEGLLQLFQVGRADGRVDTSRVAELVRGDPGFAFNVARLLREGGAPLGDSRQVELTERLDQYGGFRIVAFLAPQELDAEAFGAQPRLVSAYRRLAGAAVSVAREAGAGVPAEWADTAILMTLRESLPLFGIANLASDNDRYGLPRVSDAAYPSEVREAVTAAATKITLAAVARAPASLTRPARAA